MTTRRRIVRGLDRALTSLSGDLLSAVLADACPNLGLCAAIATDPRRLAARVGSSGWELLFLEDGEAEPITPERFQDVIVYWREFAERYLADVPTLPRAA